MLNNKSLYLIGYASGIAGADANSGKGPLVIQHSPYLSLLRDQHINFKWQEMVQSKPTNASTLSQVAALCQQLAQSTAQLTREEKPFVVFGGDHTSAIGTWSGVASAKREEGDIGLIWIDAHMDSHTPESTLSGNLHGMPVACLLGQGNPSLTTIGDHLPKIKPENMCLIGIRSYEDAELALLEKLKVKIFYMEEVNQRGMSAILQEAIAKVTKNTTGYGISIDIDSMDPKEAPGTGVAEPNGIRANDLCSALTLVANDKELIGAEIVEFDPVRDREQVTEKIIIKLISALTLGTY